MGVVFDEVVGNVVQKAPESDPSDLEKDTSPSEEVLLQKLRWQLHHITCRKARLHAD